MFLFFCVFSRIGRNDRPGVFDDFTVFQDDLSFHSRFDLFFRRQFDFFLSHPFFYNGEQKTYE